MSPSPTAPPHRVQQLAADASARVQEALDFALDETDATLPVIDHYLTLEQGQSTAETDDTAAAMGCHFGEVVRARFQGRWVLPDDDPAHWRLELADVGLSFFPMAIAYQAQMRGADERHDDGLTVRPEDRVALSEALERMVRQPEDVYFALANRYDTLETIVDFLVAKQAHDREEQDALGDENDKGT